jgi:hypothetical protein
MIASISVIDCKTNRLVTNIPIGSQNQSLFDTDTLTQWAGILGTSGVIATAIIGIWTYKQGSVIRKKDKQKDIVLPLIHKLTNQQR